MNVAIGRYRSRGSVGVECDAKRCCRIVWAHSLTAGALSASPSPGRHGGAVHQRKSGAK
jgi:hypothetical protein